MRRSLKIAFGVIVLGGFVVIFMSAGGLDIARRTKTPTPTPVVLQRGHYLQYLFAISDISGKNKKLAQFDPTLPSDDATVLSALKVVAREGYGTSIDDAEQPVVETINEVNYVTFMAGRTKVFYELFRNSNGQVGTVRFWQE